jgi:ATP-binding protein involved in chromosome partitioning
MQPPGGAQQKFALPNIQYLVAVASGKGGVGKSTVAANLAFALLKRGKAVGLMDADIYGPSIPTMLGIGDVNPQTTPFPIERHGLRVMSMGFLLGPDKAAVLRGPMVQKYLLSFLTQIDWGRLDYLLVDMPPGTGDAQLALAQTAPVAGTIIVTTPQDVSLNVARRGLQMFRQVQVPILGVVENMSYFIGEDGKRYELFGKGGGRKLAAESGVPLLGEIPIDPRVAESGDLGEPVVHRHPDSPVALAYLALADAVDKELRQARPPKELPEVQL